MSFRKAYTFDDIALVPQFNNIPSRTEPLWTLGLLRIEKCRSLLFVPTWIQ